MLNLSRPTNQPREAEPITHPHPGHFFFGKGCALLRRPTELQVPHSDLEHQSRPQGKRRCTQLPSQSYANPHITHQPLSHEHHQAYPLIILQTRHIPVTELRPKPLSHLVLRVIARCSDERSIRLTHSRVHIFEQPIHRCKHVAFVSNTFVKGEGEHFDRRIFDQ